MSFLNSVKAKLATPYELETKSHAQPANGIDLSKRSTSVGDCGESIMLDPDTFEGKPVMEAIHVINLTLAQALSQAGPTYALAILKDLQEYYDLSNSQRPWCMSSFALTIGVFIFLSGRLGDIYGIKRVMVVGYFFTCIFSILAGTAYWVPAKGYFPLWRGFQGLGISLVVPNAAASIQRTYKDGNKKKGIVLFLFGWGAPLGGCLGPFFAGLIGVKTKYWNWSCWAFGIACFAGMLMTIVSCPTFKTRPQSMDWIGAFLYVMSLGLFIFVWNQSAVDGWQKAYIIVLLIVSVALMIAWFYYEVHYASNPLLPMMVFKKPRMLTCIIIMSFCWGTFGVTNFHFFEFNLFRRNYSSLGVGAAVLPGVVSGAVAALASGFLQRHIPLELLLVFTSGAFVGVSILMATLPVHQTFWRNTFAIYILAPWGVDFGLPTASAFMEHDFPENAYSLAASLTMSITNLSVALFLGIAGTVETQIAQQTHDTTFATRCAQYFAIGTGGMGMALAAILALVTWIQKRNKPANSQAVVSPQSSADRSEDRNRDTSVSLETHEDGAHKRQTTDEKSSSVELRP